MKLRSGMLILAVGLEPLGCSGDGQTAELGAGMDCVVLDTRRVSPDDMTPLGTPNEIVLGIGRDHNAPLRWFSHSSGRQMIGDTELTVELLPDPTSAIYETRKARDAVVSENPMPGHAASRW